MPLHPEILWAQRSSETIAKKNVVYLTVNLPNIIESSIKLELAPTKVSFKATARNVGKGLEENEYEFDLDLFEEIVPEESRKYYLTRREFYLVLRKKEHKAEYWPRLQKVNQKLDFIRIDFDRWAEEDESEGEHEIPDHVFGWEGAEATTRIGGLDFENLEAADCTFDLSGLEGDDDDDVASLELEEP